MIFDRLFASSESTSTTSNPRQWFIDWANGGRRSSAGVAVSPTSALALSAYYGSIRNISEDVAKLPFKLYEQLKPRGKKPLPDHSLYSVLHDSPNDEQTAMEFWELVMSWALGWGNGISEIVETVDGSRIQLHPIHPSRVTIERDEQRRKVYRVQNDNGTQVVLPQNRVFDIHGLGDGLRGYSVARMGCESIGRALATQEYSASLFGQGTLSAGIFKTPGPLSEDAMKRLRKTWPRGLPSAHEPMFLEEGMEWQPLLGIPAKEAQMLETMEFTVVDIARWFRMPPHKIASLDRATFSNIEQQSIDYVVDTLLPWLVRIQQEVKRKLISPSEPRVFAEHVVAGLLRGDSAARAAFHTAMFNIGVKSQNDIREDENENGIGPQGDKYYVPMSLTSGDDDENENQVVVRDNPPSSPAESPKENEPETQAVAVMHRPVFLAVAERLVRKEANAVLRSHKRHRTVDGFNEWAVKFFAEYAEDLFEGFIAPIGCLSSSVIRQGAWMPPLQPFCEKYASERQAVACETNARGDVKDLYAAYEGAPDLTDKAMSLVLDDLGVRK